VRVVVVGYWLAGVSISDGFVQRNARVIEALRASHEVVAIALASPGAEPAPDYDLVVPERVASEVVSRSDRVYRALKVAVGRLGLNAAERRVRREVAAARPDVIVALLRRRPELVAAVADIAPTAYFSEEHVAHWHGGRRSGVPPFISWLLRHGRRRAARTAEVAVVLSDAEAAISEEVLGLEVLVVPHAFELARWEEVAAPALDSGPLDVLMVANAAQERNATGLLSVLDALDEMGWPADLRLRVVSDAGYLPSVEARASARVDLVGSVADLRPLYAGAVATLVPDFHAKGVKNGVIQGWATGTLVVATAQSAATVGGVDGVDLLVGDTPRDLARRLCSLTSRDQHAAIVATGRRHVDERFSNEQHDAALERLIGRLAAS
jgi:glycosyltransferase involved in cell wall biosynthesis